MESSISSGEFVIYAITFTLFFMFVDKLYQNRHRFGFIVDIYFKSGIKSYLQAFGFLFLTVNFGFLLMEASPDFLKWGWTHLLTDTGGNVATLGLNPEYLEQNVVKTSSSLKMIVISTIFYLVLVPAMPFIVYTEEKWFRKGYVEWGSIFIQSLKFGFMHLIFGLPLFVGFVLTLPGMLFASIYRKHHLLKASTLDDAETVEHFALTKSTAVHTIYNFYIITVIYGIFTVGSVFYY